MIILTIFKYLKVIFQNHSSRNFSNLPKQTQFCSENSIQNKDLNKNREDFSSKQDFSSKNPRSEDFSSKNIWSDDFSSKNIRREDFSSNNHKQGVSSRNTQNEDFEDFSLKHQKHDFSYKNNHNFDHNQQEESKKYITEADDLRSKHTMIIQLNALEVQGARLTKTYTMYDDLDDIHFELLRQTNIVDCTSTVDQWMAYIVVGVFLIEWINHKLGAPLYFNGVGEYMQKNVKSIQVPLQRCYHRYVHYHQNNPIWDVVKAIGVSLFGYHMQSMLMVPQQQHTGGNPGGGNETSSFFSMLPMMMKTFGGMGMNVPNRANESRDSRANESRDSDMKMPPSFKHF